MEDYLYKLLSIYYYFPQPLKQILGKIYNLLPLRLRYAEFYNTYLDRIKLFQKFDSEEDIFHEQSKLLFEHVNEAIKNVPFYSNYKKCDSLETFHKYPVINKSIITESFPELINPKLESKKISSNTGGSSGTPMELYLEKNISRPKEKAHFNWYWGQYGYKHHDKTLMVRGLPLAYNRTFEYNTIDNILNVSCYNINEDNIHIVIQKINHFKPKFIHAYPSSLKILTSLLENHKDSLNCSIKSIFLGSEHLAENDREYFEGFYSAKVVNWYGHSERLIHGGNCPYSNEFHFYPFYGFIELLDENNKSITQPGKEGRIVATGYDNRVNPFIRYDTGDMGVLSKRTECKCGFRGTTLSKISGRDQDIIILSDNTNVSLTAFIFGQHLEAFKRIREMQVIQHDIGKIEIKIVKSYNFTVDDEKSVVQTLLKSVNNKVDINISYTDSIPKTHRGKNIFFVSRLKNSSLKH